MLPTFEITIQRKASQEAGWPVVVDQSEPGSFLPLRSEGVLRLNQQSLMSQPSLLAYGRYLGETLFQGAIRDALMQVRARHEAQCRVLLFVEAPELKGLHWERLCIPVGDNQWDFLALDQRLPYSLYLPSTTDRRFPPIGQRDLRSLVFVANPAGLADYGLADFDAPETVAGIARALGPIPFDILSTSGDAGDLPTIDRLCERITHKHYSLLHITAHGRASKRDGDTYLYLADDNNQAAPISGTGLITRLRRLQGARGLPHCIVLAACESASPDNAGTLGGLAQRLVGELGVPAVLAMTDQISMTTAEALTTHFYRQLRQHGEVDRALTEACAGLAGRHDVTVPALYSRLGGRPLFGDTVDRELTPAEVDFGLSQLEALMPQRAPSLVETLVPQAALLRGFSEAAPENLSQAARLERDEALTAVNAICDAVLDLNFRGLALGQEPPPYDAHCPFLGLAAFHIEDRAFFFGREALVTELAEYLQQHHFLALLGPSGSGKSSIALAGLTPLFSDHQLAYMLPGSDPILYLEKALPAVASANQLIETPTLLVVDQFEEVFTLCTDSTRRQAFFERLLALTESNRPALKVILTMRADFWGDCAPYRDLAALMQANQKLIAPMNVAELRSAMEQQAHAVGLRFEADLSNTILDDVRDEPGAMPLLQHALRELWQRRQGRWLRADAYRAIGYETGSDGEEGRLSGIRGAIAATADKVYAEALSPHEQQQIKNIFLRLTRLGDDTDDESRRETRRRVNLADLVPAGGSDAGQAATRHLVQWLANERLLVTSRNQVTGQEEVEVAHEALIRYWPRLRRWLAEDRELLRLHQRIGQEAQEWQAGGRQDALLPRWNARLEEAIALAGQPNFVLNDLEQSYLEACVALRDREAAEREQQQRERLEAAEKLASEQQRRAEEQAQANTSLRRRAVWLAIAGIVALILATAATILGFQSNQNAAEAQNQANLALTSEAQANANANLAATNEAQAVANADLAATREAQAEENAILARDREADAVAAQLEAEEQATLAFSRQLAAQALTLLSEQPDLALLLSVEALRLQDTTEARQSLIAGLQHDTRLLTYLRGHAGSVTSVAFSPSGPLLASSGMDETLLLWDLTNPLQPRQFDPPVENSVLLQSLAFSWDGNTLAGSGNVVDSGVLAAAIFLWDTSNPAAPRQLGQPLLYRSDSPGIFGVDFVKSLAFSPDNTTLAAHMENGQLVLWEISDLDNPRQVTIAEAGGSIIDFDMLAFNASGGIMALGAGSAVDLWDVSNPESPLLLNQITGYSQSLASLAFSPDGTTLAVGGFDRTLDLWDLSSPETPLWLSSPENNFLPQARDLAFSPDGSTLAVTRGDNRVLLWNVSDPRNPTPIEPPLLGHKLVANKLAFSPDGEILAIGNEDGTVSLWNLSTPRSPLLLSQPAKAHTGSVLSLAFSPDGRVLVSGGEDNKLVAWNSSDPQRLQPLADQLEGHTNAIEDVAFRPDGQLLASASRDMTVRLWDLSNPQSPKRLGSPLGGHDPQARRLAFSQEGDLLVVTTGGLPAGGAVLWDISDPQQAARLDTDLDLPDGAIGAAFSPVEPKLATGGLLGNISLWDMAERTAPELLGVPLKGHESLVWDIAFSPDGQTLASGSLDSTVRLWDVSNPEFGIQLGPPLTAHEERVAGVAWSPNGRLLASASVDETIIVWDVSNPQSPNQLGQLLGGHANAVQVVAFSPDSKVLAAGDSDGEIILWDMDPVSWENYACRLANRNITWGEWQQYLGAIPYRPTCEDKPFQDSLIEAGRTLAGLGNVEAAQTHFQQISNIAPELEINPNLEIAEALLESGEGLLNDYNVEGAIIRFRQLIEFVVEHPDEAYDANELAGDVAALLIFNGSLLAVQYRMDDALAAYQAALTFDPAPFALAETWNAYCWFGSLSGRAADVLPTCSLALEAATTEVEQIQIRDSRGLARALTGDYANAILDFEAFVAWLKENVPPDVYEQYGPKREAWIEALRAGQNPFDAETLEALRNE